MHRTWKIKNFNGTHADMPARASWEAQGKANLPGEPFSFAVQKQPN
jgi:hypothetical protein